MNTTTRLREIQECMSRVRGEGNPITPADLGAWMSELETARDELDLASRSLRTIGDVNDALRLISRLFDAAHTTRVAADEVRSLLELMQGWLEQMLEEVRPLYF